MRILGVSKKWDKLEKSEWTTFRFARKDKDWEVDEQVKVVYHPRSKEREIIGIAKIVQKELRYFYSPNIDVPKSQLMGHAEAKADGFKGYFDMWTWLKHTYGDRIFNEPMNKLSLVWLVRYEKEE